VRPRDLQQWIDLGLEGREIIPAADQAAIKEKVADFLIERNPVTIDGKRIEPVLDRIHFVRRSLRMTGVVDPPEDLPILSATLGVIFAYPITGLPQEVSMEWELFGDRIREVPTVATDEAGGLPYTVSPDDPILTWKNFLKNPSSASLVDLAPPPEPRSLNVGILSVVCLLVLAGLAYSAVRAPKRRSWPVLTGAVILVALGIVLWPYARVTLRNPMTRPTVTGPDAQVIVTGLLRNVYRAFDFRDESVIYDTLERSAAGDLPGDETGARAQEPGRSQGQGHGRGDDERRDHGPFRRGRLHDAVHVERGRLRRSLGSHPPAAQPVRGGLHGQAGGWRVEDHPARACERGAPVGGSNGPTPAAAHDPDQPARIPIP
ncbi:MAG: hypothetical protein ACYTA3_14325, partial [Planctomycetota bacterium]